MGVVLYECLTGIHPFISKYNKDTMKNIVNKEPDFSLKYFPHKLGAVKNLLI